MCPTTRRKLRQELRVVSRASGLPCLDGSLDLDGVPQQDGGGGRMRSTYAIERRLKAVIADFPVATEENRTCEPIAINLQDHSKAAPSAAFDAARESPGITVRPLRQSDDRSQSRASTGSNAHLDFKPKRCRHVHEIGRETALHAASPASRKIWLASPFRQPGRHP